MEESNTFEKAFEKSGQTEKDATINFIIEQAWLTKEKSTLEEKLKKSAWNISDVEFISGNDVPENRKELIFKCHGGWFIVKVNGKNL